MRVVVSVGGRFHAFQLARQLEKRGYLKRIFTSYPYFKLRDEGIPRERIICLPIKEMVEHAVSKIPYLNRYTRTFYFMASLYDWQVSRLIEDCDIFIGWSGFSLFTLRKIHKSFSTKTILERSSPHIQYQRDDLLGERERTGMKVQMPDPGLVKKELEEYQETDYVSVPSRFVQETFIEKGFSPHKLIRATYGVDAKVFYPIPKEDNVFRIISVGLRLIKGVHYLLKAVEELNLKNLELWLIGGINYDVRPLLRKHSSSVRFIGHVPQGQLYRYYSQGSVFIQPSLEDGFGLAILEAMACGLPVICSTLVGARDVINEGVNGFVVPVRDVEALKEKIVYLYQNPARAKEMGREARIKVKSSFTWEDYGKRIIDFLNKI